MCVATDNVSALEAVLGPCDGDGISLDGVRVGLRLASAPARVVGIAFRCDCIDDLIEELDTRGVAHGDPLHARLPLTGFVGEDVDVSLCELAQEVPTPPRVERRALGVRSVAEIVVGAADLAKELGRWQALLQPVRPAEQGLWHLEPGPSLRVVPHERDAVLGMKLRVASLHAARSFLETAGTPWTITGAGISPDPRLFGGLDVLLVD